jgi:plastocyanin
MPAKAKLTTRERTTSNVSSDNLNKGSELSFAEADSNFFNLRDQSFAISDGTTSTDIEAGETITFSGASVSGNTVTITGGSADLGNLQVNDTTLSPITTNDDLILEANGTGTVSVYDNLYVTSQGRTGAQLGDLLRVQPAGASGVTINHEGTYQGTIFEVAGSQGQDASYRRPFVIAAENGNGTGGSPANTDGRVYINGIKFPMGPGANGQVLTTNGTDEYSWSDIGSVLDPLTFVGDDSSGSSIDLGNTLKVEGATGITTSVSSDTLTITGPDLTPYATASSTTTFTNKSGNISQWTNDSNYITTENFNQADNYAYKTISVAGQSDIVADSNTDTLTIAAGDNITLTTDASTDTLTITGPNVDLGDLSVVGSEIIAPSNGDLQLSTSGTGRIRFNADIEAEDGGNIVFRDHLKMDVGTDSNITTQSTSNLTMSTGLGGSTKPFIKLNGSSPHDIEINCVAAGRLDFLDPNSTITSTTVGSNGAASALTANPVGYLKIKIAGTEYQIPYYNV